MVFGIFKKKENRRKSQFLEKGFHSDVYLLKFVDSIIGGCEVFIETGANVGSTLAYVARTYPHIQCLSCEPDKEAFEEAKRNTEKYPNVKLYNLLSQDFVGEINKERQDLFSRDVLFWLDAHGYGFRWPLKDELSFMTANFAKGYIFIDDFLVPGLDCFKYDTYQDQVCSFDFVKGSLAPRQGYRLYYPAYTDRTSPHHPLTGWGLIEFGHADDLVLPLSLKGKIKSSSGF